MLDGTDIKYLWKPVLPAVEGQFGLPMPLYPPVEARSASCFTEYVDGIYRRRQRLTDYVFVGNALP